MFDVINTEVIQLMKTVEQVTSLRAYPANYQGEVAGAEHVRFHVIGPNSTRLNSGNKNLYKGILKISILVPAGGGSTRGAQLGTLIKSVFEKKTLPSGLSFSTGSLNNYGLDSVLKSHWRVDFTNNFLISGE